MQLGRSHPLMRRLRSLRRDAKRRSDEGVLLAEGLHLAAEALAGHVEIELAVHSPALIDCAEGRRLRDELGARGVPLYETSPRQLDTLQDARSPQPLLTLVRWKPSDPTRLLDHLGEHDLVLVAHGVQDPGNLGSILRSAHAAGAAALIACGPGADLTHPRTVRATMGSIFRLPATRADAGPVRAELQQRGFRTLGSSPRPALSYTAADWTGALALFVGGEGAGLPDDLLAELDDTVSIPMQDGAESLSVGAAAAVLLFEAARQRAAG